MKQLLIGLLSTITLVGLGHAATDQIMCTMQYDPVCGVDGATYGNSCMAGDVEIAYEGECTADDMKICTMQYDPVCGIDGVTYGNSCMASDVEIAYEGECLAGHPVSHDDTPLFILVDRGHEHGLTIFSTPETFMPTHYITREQAAKMIVQTIDSIGLQLPENRKLGCAADDQDLMDPSLEPFVNRMCQMGLYQGYQNRIMPRDPITYNHMDIILRRIAEKTPDTYGAFDALPVQDNPHTPLMRSEALHILYLYHTLMPTTTQPENPEAQTQLNEARSKRNTFEISSYELIQKRSCYCPEEYTKAVHYAVTNGSISNAQYADDNTELTVKIALHTIPEAFDIIQQAIDSNAARIDVTYNTIYGYPESIYIDQDEMIADEETYLAYTLMIDGQGNNELQGTWSLSMFDSQDVGHHESTITFSVDRVHAKFCNTLNSTYQLSKEEHLSFGPMMTTQMYCKDETLMQMESLFGQIQYPTYTLTQESQKLTITHDDHTFVFTRD